MKNLKAFSIRIAATTILLTWCMTSAYAAEKISLDDLYVRFKGKDLNRSVDVITQDGRTHHTRRFSITATQLTLYGPGDKTENLDRDTVTRIKIRQRGRYIHHIAEKVELIVFPVTLLCWNSCSARDKTALFLITAPFFAPVTVPIAAYTAASVPVVFALEGISLFIPPKVYDIVP